jgi:hypothetical protein
MHGVSGTYTPMQHANRLAGRPCTTPSGRSARTAGNTAAAATAVRQITARLTEQHGAAAICDNFSPHRHASVRTWCAANQVELVFTPTYGSWLNWIEAEFAALRYFALNGTDHRSHTEQNAAIASYVRWRNIRATPKVNFATDSPIRTWTDYPTKVA